MTRKYNENKFQTKPTKIRLPKYDQGRKLITNKKLTGKPPTGGNERKSAISFTGRKGRLHPSVTSRTD